MTFAFILVTIYVISAILAYVSIRGWINYNECQPTLSYVFAVFIPIANTVSAIVFWSDVPNNKNALAKWFFRIE